MILKGKTTIQLFDAKTNKLVDTVEKTNLITNAINNVFNCALQALFYTSNNGSGKHEAVDYLFDLPSGYNLAKALLGGVLIFSNTIEENVDHVIPSISEINTFIGCGNQGTSIPGNTFKGSLNSTESEQGDNYIKFVWDFTTEQCNGDIACICLTSDCGGELGYGFDAFPSSGFSGLIGSLRNGMWSSSDKNALGSTYNPMFWSSHTIPDVRCSYAYNGYFYCVDGNSVYKYNISKLIDTSKVGIDLFSTFSYGKVSTYDDLIQLSGTITSVYKVYNCADDDCVYEYNENQSDSSVLTLIRISGDAVEETISIPTSNIIASIYDYHSNTSSYKGQIIKISNNAIIDKDKIYFLTGRVNNSNLETYPNKLRIYVLSFDGSFTYKDIDCTSTVVSMLFGTTSVGGGVDSDMGIRFIKLFNTLFIQSKDYTNGYSYFMVDSDGNLSKYPILATNSNLYNYGRNLHTDNPWLTEPWVSFKFVGNGGCESINLIMGYLATINNQETILTKTADKTMRITYTLTQE